MPNEAVQSDGCCQVVFVRDKNYLKADAPKVFHILQQIRTGRERTTPRRRSSRASFPVNWW